MKIILTNDDGIDAPGLAALSRSLTGMGEIFIAAPLAPQSGVGHRVTTHDPIQVKQLGQNRFGIDGTPADCARIALKCLAPGAQWLISGINPGANLGSDVYNSGTVAAAREAAILGCRAIAISQYIARNHEIDWEATSRQAGSVLSMLLRKDPGEGFFWNANLPHPIGPDDSLENELCPLDTNPHQYTYRIDGNAYLYEGTIHERPRDPGKDVAVCFGGKVSVTRIGL
jgi:5'-nucleotidase